MEIVPLHVHTEYSFFDSTIRIKELIAFCQEHNMQSCAITDHGVMYGAIEFYNETKKAGIKPIIGCEFYIYNGEISEKDPTKTQTYHLVLLAKNMTGYKNLMKLTSIAHCDGFYNKPRINHKLLEQYSEGLICLSGCIFGEVARYILDDDYQKASDTAKYYKKLFKDDYYMELQDHGLKEEKQTNPCLIKLAKELDIPLVITNDSHYLNKDDADLYDTLLCIQSGKAKNNPDRMRFPNNEFYIKTKEQLQKSFGWMYAEEFEKCIENTNKIVEKCDLNIEFDKSYLPNFDLPKGHSAETYLEEMAKKGLQEKYKIITPEIEKRYTDELDTINKMGVATYFLILQDIIKYAKTQDIPVGPGRGSAAGSIINYALNITDIDPLKHNLLFERFLNPKRVRMPNIDIDVCIKGREKIIDYIIKKYGFDNVCHIIAFAELKAKATFKAVARAYELPVTESNAVASLIPQDLYMTLSRALEVSPEFKKVYDEKEDIRAIIDEAIKIEGIKQGAGMHGSGIIISPIPLNEITPIQPAKIEGIILSQYSLEYLEQLGLLKFDFLGFQALTIINDAIKRIKKSQNIDINISKIPLDDKKTFEMITAGNTDGVFQFECQGIKTLAQQIKPDNFEDLDAMVALYRPGPLESGMLDDFIERKHGEQKITYIHPILEPILKETYGTIVYQEQIMQIFHDIAGYNLFDADIVHKIMGKNKIDEILKHKNNFIEGAAKNGIAEKDAIAIYEQILNTVRYCFNKAHSIAYAFISYQMAYLKCNYPAEYMSALLSVNNDPIKVKNYIEECDKIGIKVLPPNINKSQFDIAPDSGNIRFGLYAIKYISAKLIEHIELERKKNPFKDIYDFCKRVENCDKRNLEVLIKIGAFDYTNKSRKLLYENIDFIIECAKNGKERIELKGKNEEFSTEEIQAFEKDLLGCMLAQ